MPELPEVETVRQQLKKTLSDQPTVTQVKALRADLRFPIPELSGLKNQKIFDIQRRAKYLLFQLNNNVLISHLGMTGYWRFLKDEFLNKHDHLIIGLSNGKNLVYNDPRRFGFVDLLEKDNIESSRWLHHLGPEPWDEELFTAKYMQKKAKSSQRNIKVFLMDQEVVVGVGNIYASEALFQAGIDPKKKAGRLKLAEWQKLVQVIPQILKQAVQGGGTTLRDYRNVFGGYGGHQVALKVYGRADEPCVVCKEPIKKAVMGGRSTYWCSKCQK